MKRWTRQRSFARSGEAPGSDNGTLWDPRPSSARERRCLGLADPDPGGRVHRGDGGAAASALWALAGHPCFAAHSVLPRSLLGQAGFQTNIRDMARRLDGVLEAAPDLAAHFPSARSGPGARASWKDRRTTGLGWLGFASAGSASQLAARTVQVAVADEVARFPRRVRSGEGSPMQLLRARLLDWGTEAKLIAISSPTLPTDTISTMFSDGDQNRLEYRCGSCGCRTPLRWGQVSGVEKGEEARVACASCGVLHSERTRRAMLPSAVWVSQKRDRVDERIASYTAGRLDSARASLTEIVLEWRAARLDAERGNPAAMLGFRNTILGEPGDLGVADVDKLLVVSALLGGGSSVYLVLVVPVDLVAVAVDDDDRVAVALDGQVAVLDVLLVVAEPFQVLTVASVVVHQLSLTSVA